MKDIRLIDADPTDGVTWELTVDGYWGNMNGTAMPVLRSMHTHISACVSDLELR